MSTLEIRIRKLDAQIATECARLSCAFVVDPHSPAHPEPGQRICKWCRRTRDEHYVIAN